ncbi:MAG: hypothetical protein E7342_05540, partial [Clostridiales bacterium]|nr:hypothetical protein [Clostridiales bacterium]
FSLALLFTSLSLGFSLISTPILFLLSFLPLAEFELIPLMAISSLFLVFVFFIYRTTKNKMKLEAVIYIVSAILPYIFLSEGDIYRKIIVGILITILSFISLFSIKAVFLKGLKVKLTREEFLCISILFIGFGVGITNILGVNFYKLISVYIILLTSYLYKTGIGAITSTILSISLIIYYNNPVFSGVYLIWYLVSFIFMDKSRYFSLILPPIADFLIQLAFNVYPYYSYVDFIFMFLGSILFCLTPTKLLNNLKEKLYSFREKQLVRQSINRNRLFLSNKLYDISNVFLEISNTFNSLKKVNNEDNYKKIIEEKIIESVCKNCDGFNNCKQKILKQNYFTKLIEIGLAKGKISFIDFPKNMTDYCLSTNSIIYALNKLLVEHRNKVISDMNMASGRAILSSGAIGVSEVLKNLALETSQTLKFQSRLERTLSTKLYEKGVLVDEVLIYGEEDLTISIIVSMKEVNLTLIEKIVSDLLSYPFSVFDKSMVTEDKIFILLKRSQKYDAVVGINAKIKEGSMTSGDTHSLIKISDSKFLVALSDGMGSGKYAESISGLALSLIENFYKAGLESELILSTVNKILAINLEDSFTALDIAVVDLKNCTADFIKYGAPYGFIINDSGIKMVESSTLPLGILEDINLSVSKTELQNGDVLLFFTDGISDAFSSSVDMIDFLRTLPAKNPQTLADEVMEKAISLNNGVKKDDMTTLAVRIFEKKAG